jgi:hypothetical protein
LRSWWSFRRGRHGSRRVRRRCDRAEFNIFVGLGRRSLWRGVEVVIESMRKEISPREDNGQVVNKNFEDKRLWNFVRRDFVSGPNQKDDREEVQREVK